MLLKCSLSQCSTMCQELESLMFLSYERGVSINYEDTVNTFGYSSEVLKKALIFKWFIIIQYNIFKNINLL